jgi:putative addiction module CopG family antidote
VRILDPLGSNVGPGGARDYAGRSPKPALTGQARHHGERFCSVDRQSPATPVWAGVFLAFNAGFDNTGELRYTRLMTTNVPLTPDQEKLVRDQLATGRFQSPSDVFAAAFRLLEEQSQSAAATRAWLKQEIDKGIESKPAAPVTGEFWENLRNSLRTAASSGNDD